MTQLETKFADATAQAFKFQKYYNQMQGELSETLKELQDRKAEIMKLKDQIKSLEFRMVVKQKENSQIKQEAVIMKQNTLRKMETQIAMIMKDKNRDIEKLIKSTGFGSSILKERSESDEHKKKVRGDESRGSANSKAKMPEIKESDVESVSMSSGT